MKMGIEHRVNQEQAKKIERNRDQIANHESAYPAAFPQKQEDSDRPPVENSQRGPSKQQRHTVAESSAYILQGKQEWERSAYQQQGKQTVPLQAHVDDSSPLVRS